MKGAVIAVSLVAGLWLCACSPEGAVTVASSVTCTNPAGVTRTWFPLGSAPGGSGSESTAAAAPNYGGKSSPNPAVDPKDIVYGTISRGLDPLDAARLFGPLTIPDEAHATDAQLATAKNPATYGWYNCH